MSYACDFDEIAPLPNIIDSLSLLLEVFQSLKFRAWSRASTIIPTMIGPDPFGLAIQGLLLFVPASVSAPAIKAFWSRPQAQT